MSIYQNSDKRLIDVFREWRNANSGDIHHIPTDEEAKEIIDYLDAMAKFKAELRLASLRIEWMYEVEPPERPKRIPPGSRYQYINGEWVEIRPKPKLTVLVEDYRK